jgi:hypothetical protein
MNELLIDRWNHVYDTKHTYVARMKAWRSLAGGTGLVAEGCTWDGISVRVYVFDDRSGFYASAQHGLLAPTLTRATVDLPTSDAVLRAALPEYVIEYAPMYTYLRGGYYVGQDIQALNYSRRNV